MDMMMYLGMWLGITLVFGVLQVILFVFTTFPIALAHHRTWNRVVQEDLRVTPMTAFERYRYFFPRHFKWGSIVMMIPLILWIAFLFMNLFSSYSPKMGNFLFFSLMNSIWYAILNFITISFFLFFPSIRGSIVNSLVLSFVFQFVCSGVTAGILLLGFSGADNFSGGDEYTFSLFFTTLAFIPILFMFCIGVMRFHQTLDQLDEQLKERE